MYTRLAPGSRFRSLFGSLSMVVMLVSPALTAPPEPKITRHQPTRPLDVAAVTEDWPSFLGPNHQPATRESHLLKNLSGDNPPLVWEMETGSGYASPAISNNRLVFFHRIEDDEVLDCLRPETGEHLWRFSYPTTYHDRYGFSNGPRSSPVIDGGRVYTMGAAGMLHCVDLESGQTIWSLDTAEKLSAASEFFGVGSTPLVMGDLLIVQVGAANGPAVVALDKKTGDIKWQCGTGWSAGYASPIPAVMHDRPRVLAFLGGDTRPPVGGLMLIDPTAGSVLSKFAFRSRRYESVNASSPVVAGDRVFISSSYKTGGQCLRVTQDDTLQPLWHTDDLGAHFATPVVYDGRLYGISGSGRQNSAIVCLDLTTGKTLWTHTPQWPETTERDGEKRTVNYTAGLGSLLLADDALLLLGEMGHLAWLEPSATGYHEISRTRLFHAAETWCLPVVSHGLLYVCRNRPDTVDKTGPGLLCYDLRAR